MTGGWNRALPSGILVAGRTLFKRRIDCWVTTLPVLWANGSPSPWRSWPPRGPVHRNAADLSDPPSSCDIWEKQVLNLRYPATVVQFEEKYIFENERTDESKLYLAAASLFLSRLMCFRTSSTVVEEWSRSSCSCALLPICSALFGEQYFWGCIHSAFAVIPLTLSFDKHQDVWPVQSLKLGQRGKIVIRNCGYTNYDEIRPVDCCAQYDYEIAASAIRVRAWMDGCNNGSDIAEHTRPLSSTLLTHTSEYIVSEITVANARCACVTLLMRSPD